MLKKRNCIYLYMTPFLKISRAQFYWMHLTASCTVFFSLTDTKLMWQAYNLSANNKYCNVLARLFWQRCTVDIVKHSVVILSLASGYTRALQHDRKGTAAIVQAQLTAFAFSKLFMQLQYTVYIAQILHKLQHVLYFLFSLTPNWCDRPIIYRLIIQVL